MKRRPKGRLLFLVTRHSCPGDYAARAKTSSLAAFAVIVLLLLRRSPTVLSISLLITLSKPCQAHQKAFSRCPSPIQRGIANLVCLSHSYQLSHTYRGGSLYHRAKCFLVDLAGVEPASRTPFIQLHTAIDYSVYLFYWIVNRDFL